ncbi:Spy/CpxP family protein refolding chaperone [Pseudoduganella lurida]|uniref:Spy/CpxP family protein refolding chaperone n=1 Tax=Pseudoduganella lurida TaxID=1036180 RepID=A0A562RJY6_9BURK|nr:Spy/CpxP family protein refolding chaperone [Pseudoduganella lurida]TWI69358.1 Spy/CpxP family protein refolding chaperone [Pseudoduganella lurida]
MKNKMKSAPLNQFLLAAALALPWAMSATSAASAAPAMDGGEGAPGQGPQAGERRGRPPGADMGPRGEAGPRGHGPGRGPGFGPDGDPDAGPGFDGMPPYLHGLDLSEAQEDRIFTILHDQIPYLRQQDKARDKAEHALFELHGAAKYDDAAAVKLAQAAAQADANITLSHLRTEQKVLAVLNAEQRKELAERREGRGPRREGGHGAPRDAGQAAPQQ